MDHIIVDIEIKRRVEDTPGGWDSTDLLGVSCAVVYEFTTDMFRIYGPNDVEPLKSRIQRADRVGGFNVWKFDFPVIWGLPGRERVVELLPKTDDMLRRIWQAQGLDPEVFTKQHGGWSLDAVAGATINQQKLGNGAMAPIWYQSGDWCRLIDYCLNDVKMERDLSMFIDEHGYVVNNYRRLEVKKWGSGK